MRKDPLRLATRLVVYIALYLVTAAIFGPLLLWAGGDAGYLTAITITGLLAAYFTNWLTLRIFVNLPVVDTGLWWRRSSSENLAIGLGGGVAAACLVLVPPLLVGASHFTRSPEEVASAGTGVFVTVLLAGGAIGEELLFRGYGFQMLLKAAGPWATVLPVGIVFGLLHSSNPNSTWFGLANTAGFGVLFGYAYLRSRDLWLPIGLHLGWNVTLPLFGVNLSGLRMKLTGYEVTWTAGPLWSGGEYGPEASILTTAVLALLFLYLQKAPVRRQISPLTDPPLGSEVCAPSSILPL